MTKGWHDQLRDGRMDAENRLNKCEDRLDRLEKALGIFDSERCPHSRKCPGLRMIGEEPYSLSQVENIITCLDCGKELK